MKHRVLSATTALGTVFGLALSAGSALAVTPEEVWENWKALGNGAEITTESEARDGDTLVITGLRTSATAPDGPVLETVMDKVSLKDLGDGTVEVSLPDSYPLTIYPEGRSNGALIELSISQPGARTIASGTAAATNLAVTAPETNLSLTKAQKSDGSPIAAKLDAKLVDMAGVYTLSPASDGKVAMDYTLTTGKLTIAGEAEKEAGSAERATLQVEVAGLKGAAKGTFLPADKMEDIAAALRDGFAIDSTASLGETSFTFDLTEASGPTKVSGKLGGADFKVLLNADLLDYGIGLTGFALDIDAPQSGLPPVSGAFGELAFGFAFPVAQSETPQPFSVLARLVDVTLSDNVWGMFDPSAQLGRDPATLIVDLKGTGLWKVDIMDPRVQSGEIPTPEVPAEVHSADLTQLLLKLAGAEVTGTGALTFDNSDLASWDGFPAPTGKLTFTLTQINALLDKLVAMGLIPEEELMGIRMGLAMFAKPASAPDQLISEVEFRDGGLYVNGQQLR